MIERLKKVYRKIYYLPGMTKPIVLTSIVFLIFSLSVIIWSSHNEYYSTPKYWRDVSVAAHGFLLDFLVLGIGFLWLTTRLEGWKEHHKKQKEDKELWKEIIEQWEELVEQWKAFRQIEH